MRRILILFALASPALAQVSQLPASAVIPVVSSTPGLSGARFRTELQMANPTDRTMSGWLLLRPQELPVRYELAPHATRSWADIVADLGVEGAGSLDLLVDAGDLPAVAARSFDDQPAGTNGVTVPLVPIGAILVSNDVAALLAPRDPAHFRFNIGIRTFDSGAGIEFVVRGEAGDERHRRFLDLGEHHFTHQGAESLLGTTLQAGDSIEVVMVSGSAIVYGATVDNRTNDAALQVLRRP